MTSDDRWANKQTFQVYKVYLTVVCVQSFVLYLQEKNAQKYNVGRRRYWI